LARIELTAVEYTVWAERRERKNLGGGSERNYIRGARNYISGFEGSQAVPAFPSGTGNAY
jgi:hypothetical protein